MPKKTDAAAAAARKKASAVTLRRAQWIIERWRVRPSLSYQEMVKEVREAFDVGRTMAEFAIARANELLREMGADPALKDRITAAYWDIYESASTAKEYRAARAALDSLRRHLGVGAPDRVENTHIVEEVSDEQLEDLSDDQVRALAALDARKA